MIVYKYVASDKNGVVVNGIVNASSLDAARLQVRALKLVVISVSIAENFTLYFLKFWMARFIKKATFLSVLSKRKLSSMELSLVTKQLASLLDAGLPLVDALTAMHAQADQAYVKLVLAELRRDVQSGSTFTSSLSGGKGGFPLIYKALVSAGEQTGKLALVLSRLSIYIDTRNKLKQKVFASLIYPLVVVVVAFLIIVFLLSYVVPQVVQAFVDGKQELPFLTVMIIFLSDLIIDWGVYFFVFFIGLFIFILRALRKPSTRSSFDVWLLGAPLIGGVIRAYNTTRFASTLCIVIGSGVPILLALQTAGDAVSNTAMRANIVDAISRVKEGTGLAKALGVQNRFPPVLLQLIQSGESTGRLSEMLDRAAQTEADELDRKVVIFTSLLEPLLILVMGGFVMMIVLAILLPIVNLNQLIQ